MISAAGRVAQHRGTGVVCGAFNHGWTFGHRTRTRDQVGLCIKRRRQVFAEPCCGLQAIADQAEFCVAQFVPVGGGARSLRVDVLRRNCGGQMYGVGMVFRQVYFAKLALVMYPFRAWLVQVIDPFIPIRQDFELTA